MVFCDGIKYPFFDKFDNKLSFTPSGACDLYLLTNKSSSILCASVNAKFTPSIKFNFQHSL